MGDDRRTRIAAGEVRVLVDAKGVAGVLVPLIGRAEAQLATLAVADRMRGRGLGRRLVAHAEAVSRAAGCDRISLFSHETMVENRAIYPRLGHVETHRARQNGFDRVFIAETLVPAPSETKTPDGGGG